MREIRLSGSEGGGTKPIASPYPYFRVVRFADAEGHGDFLICINLLRLLSFDRQQSLLRQLAFRESPARRLVD